MPRDHLFISYRRDDARGTSGRLYDWLCIAFGRERVFRDVHSIGVGRWRDAIDAALARSAACIAVIGPRWADATNLSRLHDPTDTLRHELVRALASEGLVVVPTLVEGAEPSPAGQLPAALHPLYDWNFVHLTEDGWHDDARRLVDEVAARVPALKAVASDLGTLLKHDADVRQRIAALEAERTLLAGQMQALRSSVDALAHRLGAAAPAERADLSLALSALAGGDSSQAEDAFEREYEARAAAAASEAKAGADAALHVANLALLHDTRKSVRFYRTALALAPDDAEIARLLGLALMQLGDLAGAVAALQASLQAALQRQDAWAEMAARVACGDLARAAGSLAVAAEAYRLACAIAATLAAEDPADPQRQRDLSVSHDRVGDVLVALGDGAGANEAFRKALAIREALAARNAGQTQWQRDLSISHERIGDVLLGQGDVAGAIDAFRRSLAIAEALAARDPAHTMWQRDLSVSHERIGDVLAAEGDAAGALEAFGRSLAIREALAAQDPANTEWQRDGSVSHNKLGDVRLAQGDPEGALGAYRRGLAAVEALAARDPANALWQRDLTVSHNKIGHVLATRGDRAGATGAYRQGLAIAEALAARDPANAEWQRDLIVSHMRLSDVTGDAHHARQALQVALAMQQAGTLPSGDAWVVDELRRRGAD